MRAVPHRVVCVVGLDDGAFPRVGSDDGDDVLARDPLVGERDPRSEDRQILLDAIHAATDTLVLLYTGADPRTNARRPPCVPLGEVLDTLVQISGSPQADGRERARDRVVGTRSSRSTRGTSSPGGSAWRARSASTRRLWLVQNARAARGFSRPAWTPCDSTPSRRTRACPHSGLARLFRRASRQGLPAQAARCLRRRRRRGRCRRRALRRAGQARAVAAADRLLSARLGGADPETATRAERARGLLPPGRAGDAVLAERAVLVDDIVATFERESLPAPATVDVAVPLGDQTWSAACQESAERRSSASSRLPRRQAQAAGLGATAGPDRRSA